MRRAALALLAAAVPAMALAGEPGEAALPGEAPAAPPKRSWHGSAGVGGALLLTGDGGDRLRADAAVDLKLGGRFGVLAAWRAFDDRRRGMVVAGVVFEGSAARPRLVLDLHAELGADLDVGAPVAGGGVRTTLQIAGPLGLVFDSGAYLVVDGIDGTRLQLQGSTLLAARW